MSSYLSFDHRSSKFQMRPYKLANDERKIVLGEIANFWLQNWDNQNLLFFAYIVLNDENNRMRPKSCNNLIEVRLNCHVEIFFRHNSWLVVDKCNKGHCFVLAIVWLFVKKCLYYVGKSSSDQVFLIACEILNARVCPMHCIHTSKWFLLHKLLMK